MEMMIGEVQCTGSALLLLLSVIAGVSDVSFYFSAIDS